MEMYFSDTKNSYNETILGWLQRDSALSSLNPCLEYNLFENWSVYLFEDPDPFEDHIVDEDGPGSVWLFVEFPPEFVFLVEVELVVEFPVDFLLFFLFFLFDCQGRSHSSGYYGSSFF